MQRNKQRNLYRKVYLMHLNYLFNTSDEGKTKVETNERHVKVNDKMIAIT